jgi:apolipoprotein N-acyltransferase
LVAASAGLQVLIFPLAGPLPAWHSWLGWIALAPLLLAILAPRKNGALVSPLEAALLGYGCGFLWYLGNCYWIYQTMYLYGGLAKPAAFGLLILFCLYLGLYHALFGWLVRLSAGKSQQIEPALFTAPFLWIAVELARAHITSFPWDQLGMSQINHPYLTTLAPWTGVYGISFVLATLSAWIVSLLLLPISWRLRQAASFCVIIFVLWPRPHVATAAPQQVAVLLQPNGDVGDSSPWFAGGFQSQLDLLSGVTTRTAAAGPPPDVVIWPESPAPLIDSDTRLQTTARSLALHTGAPVIIGDVAIAETPEMHGRRAVYNSASFYDARGDAVGRYDKMHLVPFGEYVPFKNLLSFAGSLTTKVGSMTPGNKRALFQTGGHSYGVFICYESIFADEVRQFARNGADVLVNISDDGWYGDTSAPWQHLNMARMRAIENRRWILRDTNSGITAAIDPEGRVIASVPRHELTALRAPFNYISETTFYTRHGDWFAYACTIIAVAMLGFALISGAKSQSPNPAEKTGPC